MAATKTAEKYLLQILVWFPKQNPLYKILTEACLLIGRVFTGLNTGDTDIFNRDF